MATIKLYNLARVTTATVGAGTITLGAAVSGYLTFALAGVVDGDTVAYAIKDGANSEEGFGVYTASGTTLTRNVRKSTNSDSAISLSGTAEVFISPSSSDLVVANLMWPGAVLINGTLAGSVSGNALTVALKTLAGNNPSENDPVYVCFRNATAATGDYSIIRVVAATSVVVSSGSTLGAPTSSVGFRIWIVGFNDAGTFRLAAINCSTWSSSAAIIYPLDEGKVASSTAEGGAGAADSAGVFYTGTAVTSKAFRILGYMEWGSGLATAGTWASGPTEIVLFGPGIRKPGDSVQRTAIDQTANDSTASTTYVVSSTTLAITPKSTANLIRALAAGPGDTVAAGRVISVRMSRGTTANTNMFGNSGVGYDAGARMITAVSVFGFDKPNTTSSTTYAVQVRDDTGQGTNWGATSNVVHLELEEIMG